MKTPGPSPKALFLVWATLLALLFMTWGAAQFNLGKWNMVVAMTIAVGKMLLVVLIFMHVRYGPRLIWIYAAAGFFWFFIMVSLGMSDYLTRGWLGF